MAKSIFGEEKDVLSGELAKYNHKGVDSFLSKGNQYTSGSTSKKATQLMTGKPTPVLKGFEVINIKKALDPNYSEETYNVFGAKNPFDITKQATGFFKNMLKPLDNMANKVNNNKFVSSIFSKIPGTEEKSLSESITKMITDNVSFDGAAYIQQIDEQIISEHFPFIGGLASDLLDAYIMPPGMHYDTTRDGYVAWENSKQDRLVSAIAKENMDPLAAAVQGVNMAPINEFYMSKEGGRDTLTNFDAFNIFGTPSSQYGNSGKATTDSNSGGTASTLGSIDLYMDKFANSLTESYADNKKNYGMVVAGRLIKNQASRGGVLGGISSELMELPELAQMVDPFFDKDYRQTIYWEGLQYGKEETTKILDGSGDWLENTWQDIGTNIRDKATGIYDNLDKMAQSTGLGVMLNPNLKKKLDKTLNKLGLPKKKGIGADLEGNPNSALLFSNVVKINGIELPAEDFIGFYEEHDYINGSFPKRVLKVRITQDTKEKGLDATFFSQNYNKLIIQFYRNFAFARSQNYDYFSVNGRAQFRGYEVLHGYIGSCDVSKFKKPDSSKKKVKAKDKNSETLKQGDNLSAYFNGIDVLEITLTSPLNELMAKPKQLFQGVTKEGTTVEGVINESFKLHFNGQGDDSTTYIPNSNPNSQLMLAMEKPEFDKDLDTIKTPMDFKGILAYYQKETGGALYNGGYNIFQDHNIVYVVRKKGPNKIEFEDSWETRLRITLSDASDLVGELYTISSVSEKMTLIGLLSDDIMFLGDYDNYNEHKEIPLYAGSPIIFGSGFSGGFTSSSWNISHTGSAVDKPTDIKKVEEFLVRIPNTYLVFRPGDTIKIEIQDTDEIFTGTVKRWASQQNNNVRCVVLQLVMNEGDTTPDADINNNPINKAIKKYKEWTAKTNDKITSKFEEWQSSLHFAHQNSKPDDLKIQSFQNMLLMTSTQERMKSQMEHGTINMLMMNSNTVDRQELLSNSAFMPVKDKQGKDSFNTRSSKYILWGK